MPVGPMQGGRAPPMQAMSPGGLSGGMDPSLSGAYSPGQAMVTSSMHMPSTSPAVSVPPVAAPVHGSVDTTMAAAMSAPLPAASGAPSCVVDTTPPSAGRASHGTADGAAGGGTGGSGSGATLGKSSAAAAPAADAANERLVSHKALQDLVKQVHPDEVLSQEVEEVLLDMADDFIDSVTAFGCAIAQHRRADTLESKDLLLHLERNWQLRIPGFGVSKDPQPLRKLAVTDGHKQRLAAVRRSLAAAAAANHVANTHNGNSGSVGAGAGSGTGGDAIARPSKSQRNQ